MGKGGAKGAEIQRERVRDAGQEHHDFIDTVRKRCEGKNT